MKAHSYQKMYIVMSAELNIKYKDCRMLQMAVGVEELAQNVTFYFTA